MNGDIPIGVLANVFAVRYVKTFGACRMVVRRHRGDGLPSVIFGSAIKTAFPRRSGGR